MPQRQNLSSRNRPSCSISRFDPQKDAEIGLGGALSFWHDRIVAGVGWNLMNNSRAYFYVGSNLIPVLQALGYGKEGGAGKQP